MSLLLVVMLCAAPPNEAAESFERGLKLYTVGDKAGALLAFQRAYALKPTVRILYNIAMTWTALDAPEKAVEAFDQVLEKSEQLTPELLERAKKARAEQAARLGELVIELPVENATVEVNSVTVGKTPLQKPVRVRAGKALVSATAPRHAPIRVEAVVPAGAQVAVPLKLTQIEQPLAHVRVASRTPGADVLIDGERVGTTPLSSTVAVTAGEHKVTLVREGYAPKQQALKLGEDDLADVRLDLEADPQFVNEQGATLDLGFSETQALVSVDGAAGRKYEGPFRVAPGAHRLVFERDGFYPVTRDLVAPALSQVSMDVVFDPIPKTLAELEASSSQRRLLGVAGLGAGGLVVAGSIGYLVYNLLASAELEQRIRTLSASCGSDCPSVLAALAELDNARNLRLISYVGMPLGALFVAAGAFALLTAPDPKKYDRAPDVDLAPQLSLSVGPSGVSVAGRF
jgi:hypothetical protein